MGVAEMKREAEISKWVGRTACVHRQCTLTLNMLGREDFEREEQYARNEANAR